MNKNFKIGDRVHVRKGVKGPSGSLYGYASLPMDGKVIDIRPESVLIVELVNKKRIVIGRAEYCLVEPIEERTLEDMVGKMEKVLVRTCGLEWVERYLVAILPGTPRNKYAIVNRQCEKDYEEGGDYYVTIFPEAKLKEVEPKLSIKIDLNGEPVDPSTLSDESILALFKRTKEN